MFPQGDILTLQCNQYDFGDQGTAAILNNQPMDPLAAAVSVGIFDVPTTLPFKVAASITSEAEIDSHNSDDSEKPVRYSRLDTTRDMPCEASATVGPPERSKPSACLPAEAGPGNFSNRHYHLTVLEHPVLSVKHFPNFNSPHEAVSREIAAIKHWSVSDEAFLASMVTKGLSTCPGFQTGECTQTKDHYVMGVLKAHTCAMCYKLKQIPLKHNLFECPFIGVNE
jgi:hypothetical protein